MKYVSIPGGRRRLPFYLAAEEYVARCLVPDHDYFFMWIVEPTVIIGRNQLMDTEVNVDYCRQHGIEIYRRKSGGGAVYADLRNIMMSYITPRGADTQTTFAAYTERVAALLRSLGIDAHAGSRNDVTVGTEGRKVSGNSFYRMGQRSIAHGTLLYTADHERMAAALTPSSAKLRSKGVESVRSRVTSITRFRPDLSIDDFMEAARRFMTDGAIDLSPGQLNEIAEIEKDYYDDSWLRGHNIRGAAAFSKRIEGVGDFYVDVQTRNGRIDSIDLKGDFFLLADLDSSLLDHLKGIDFDRESVMAALALKEIDPADTIYGLTRDELVNLLF
ncbi:MAG: hypothetical protein NC342_02110 [Pseudoflavonifractor sp.]|nr:lipoyltransferase [Alloprevotella sp.]MCM1116319.1 hypothetical protein [Pseudoflavonifractor sp.]